MKQLSYVDEHAISVDADRAETWSALLRVVCRDPDDPSSAPRGFVLDEATPNERLALTGRHPFSVYQLVFELADDGPQRTRLSALTWADFPGLSGRAYRALVIGTGGHRVVVRRMLQRIAAAAPPSMPCDALAPGARTRADRTISIDAPPTIVFSWLCQLRVAPYSYDLLDNLGRRSPRQRTPELMHLEVGQRFMSMFALHSFVDGEQITLRSKAVAVTYAVRPQGAGSRLHVRVLFAGPSFVGRVLERGDAVMMRKQLLTLKSLAEHEEAAVVKSRPEA